MFLFDIVLVFVVYVDIGSFNIRKTWDILALVGLCEMVAEMRTFQLSLKCLANVMRDLQRHVFIHDNIHLNVIFLSGMICATLSNISNCQPVQ